MKTETLAGQHMRSVLRDRDSGGGSVMVAIAVVAVLSSCVPVVQHLSPMLA